MTTVEISGGLVRFFACRGDDVYLSIEDAKRIGKLHKEARDVVDTTPANVALMYVGCGWGNDVGDCYVAVDEEFDSYILAPAYSKCTFDLPELGKLLLSIGEITAFEFTYDFDYQDATQD